ncbi:hypothetical protein MSG28_010581 [Choristoneura fumiferana]|uniref:Uncharacterized protein n=1 Tax=Choristoneura fumiferana TaxID=7141 RepID=A0ACC0KMZ1_CHOFU|nr:hypothetical protein MSG28_010581 [Choristoneura fumiferana]
MPKRKHQDNEEYDSIARKIKRLSRKLKKARPRRRILSSGSSSTSPDRNSAISLIAQEDSQHENSQLEDQDVTQEPEPEPSTSTAEPASTNVETTNTDTPLVSELDEETLLILGDDPSATQNYGKDIQAALAVRLQHIATMGLTKEQRKELQDKHLPPANCTLINGPVLNPEIKAAVSDVIAKRDKGIEHKQNQMANAISCIGEAISLLISSEEKNPTLMKLLMDAGRLLCDCQHTDTTVRRMFILNSLKKDMKDQLQSTKVDKYLFGQDLADTLKSAKAICKTGAELKTAPVKPPVKKPPPKTAANRSYLSPNLNWKAPAPGRRQPAQQWSQRTREPAYPRGPPASSSRTSYAAPNRGRR